MYLALAQVETLLDFDPIKFQSDVGVQQGKAAVALDQLWTNVISNGGAWKGMSQAGAFVAVFTLALFMFYLMKSWTSNEYDTPISELVWPLIVALLLANSGKFAAEMALGFRGVINIQIANVQRSMTNTDEVNKKIADTTATQAGLQEINALYDKCKTTSDPVEYNSCLASLKTLVDDKNSKIPGAAIFKSIQQKVDSSISTLNAIAADPGGVPGAIGEAVNKSVVTIGTGLLRTAGAPGLLLLKPIVSGLAYLYQWLMELAMLATALLLPMALAVSLMPEHKAIYAWLTAMLSIANAKLCYIVIVAWGAEAMLTDPSQDFIFLMFTGLGAPLFSLVLASGGGLAMYSAFTDVLSVAASAGVQAVGSGVKMMLPVPK